MDIKIVDSPMDETLYEIVLDSMPIGVIMTDTQGNILMINKAAEEIYNFPQNMAFGRDFLLFLAEYERPRMKKTFDYVVNTGKAIRASRVFFELNNGKKIWLNCYASLFKYDHGNHFGVAMWIEDITDIKMLEEEIIRADRLAALGQLSIGISHEIRTPLGSIKALTSLIKKNGLLSEQEIQYLDVIIDEVNRLDSFSKKLLEFAGSSNYIMQKVNIQKVLDSALFLIKLNNCPVGLRYEENFQNNLPLVWGNSEKLVHVFLNLISNAVDAVKEQGTIKFDVYQENGWVIIKVTDSGIGIPAENLNKIFDPFFTSKEQGTGLGLSVVHTIISEHHGHIYFNSQENMGTTVEVRLPQALEEQNNG